MKNLLLIIASLLLISCTKNMPSPVDGANNPPPARGTLNLNQTLILQLVNEQRTKGCNCGTTAMPPVAPLTWNNQLAEAALAHSTDMFTNNFFSHTSSNGNTLSKRIDNAGYKWSAIAENIAMGQKDEQTVIAAWFNSEGHCKNLMSTTYKEMGAARKGNYWTQNFGAAR